MPCAMPFRWLQAISQHASTSHACSVPQRRRSDAQVVLDPVFSVPVVPAEAHFLAGTIHEDEGRYEPALACYEAALARDPNFDRARNNIGTTLLGLQRYTDAREVFLSMLQERRGTGPANATVFNPADWAGPEGTTLRTCRARLDDLAAQLRHMVEHDVLEAGWEQAAALIDQSRRLARCAGPGCRPASRHERCRH